MSWSRVPEEAIAGSSEAETTHPAVRAWSDFAPGSAPPEGVEVLKRPRPNGKSAVFKIGPVGCDGVDVVAKELFNHAARIERVLYCDVLPQLSVNGPTYIGSIESKEESKTWLFLEAITGPPFDKTQEGHMEMATRWLGALHAETLDRRLDADLPSRGPGYYEALLQETTKELERSLTNPELAASNRQTLRKIIRHLQALLSCWPSLAGIYSSVRVSVVHGDFKKVNMAFARLEDSCELRVFDWSEAHWGPIAVDLWGIDVEEYRRVFFEYGIPTEVSAIERWRHLGWLIRLILSVAWEVPRLRFPWVERPMRRLELYESRLDAALDPKSGCER